MQFLNILLTTLLYSNIVAQSIPTIDFKLIETIHHDPSLFTQGLIYDPPYLYESSGLYGKSKLTQYHWPTRKIIKNTPLASYLFAEGLAIEQGELVQLTWREHNAIVYNLALQTPKRIMHYQGEGWGLANNGQSYIMTSGNHCYQHRRHKDFELIKTTCLTHPQARYWQLNDITYNQGYIYANVWYKDFVIKIHEASGDIAGIIPLDSLRKKLPPNQKVDVLNGITTLSHNTLLITGKYWPLMFIIRLI